MKLLQSIAALLAALMIPASPSVDTERPPELPESEWDASLGMELDRNEEMDNINTEIQPESETQEPIPEEPAQPTRDWNLLLVNRWNPLPQGYTLTKAILDNGQQVDERIYDALCQMLEDCEKTGLRPVVCSAYRTQARQTYLYNNKIARLRSQGYSREAAEQEAMRWVAVPGTSEHQTGMAVDIVAASYQVLDEKQAETAEQKWLMEHCWEYGFILRYPSDKTELTGIGYEPWHYRYVGVEAALAMRDSGLCLEEYLSLAEQA